MDLLEMRFACFGPFRKSGSPNVMCLLLRRSGGGYLPSTISRLHNSKVAVVDRDDGTMPAKVLTPAARFGVSYPTACPIAGYSFGYRRQHGKCVRSGTEKCAAVPTTFVITGSERVGQPREPGFELSPTMLCTPSWRRWLSFRGAYKPVAAKMSIGIQIPYAFQHRNCEPVAVCMGR